MSTFGSTRCFVYKYAYKNITMLFNHLEQLLNCAAAGLYFEDLKIGKNYTKVHWIRLYNHLLRKD